MPAEEKGSVNYEKILLMKCTKSIDDMGTPWITPWIQDSIIGGHVYERFAPES